MTAKIVNLMQYLIENRDEAHGAVKRVMLRPFPYDSKNTPTDDQIATWVLEGLWLEGYRVVRVADDE